jgi:hypothetical protein
MDIRRWLEDTELPEQPPSPPEPLRLQAFSQPNKVETAPEDRPRRRKRSVTDSSLLDSCPRHKRALAAEEQSASDRCGASDRDADASSSGSSPSSQLYARKPRRKTRPERYEPAKDVKERGTQVYRHRKGESKKARRKTRRRKGDRPDHGVVQSFQAKNVPRDRLTVRRRPYKPLPKQ